MPQLNPEFYLSQIFWLVVTFTFLLFFLWKVSLPRIRNAIEIRNNKISNDLEIAKKSQENGEKIQAEIDNALAAANNKAQSKINDTISQFSKEMENKILKLNKELEIKINESGKKIELEKENSLNNIKSEVENLTKISFEKLMGENLESELLKNKVNTVVKSINELK